MYPYIYIYIYKYIRQRKMELDSESACANDLTKRLGRDAIVIALPWSDSESMPTPAARFAMLGPRLVLYNKTRLVPLLAAGGRYYCIRVPAADTPCGPPHGSPGGLQQG